MKLTVQQPNAREIKVKLLLAGGQSIGLTVAPENPLLAQLLAAVARLDGEVPAPRPAVFQIPMEGGRASLAFAAVQLVAVITDPAVLIQSDAQAGAALAAPMPSVAVAAAAAASASQGHGDVVRHPVVEIESFLSGSEIAWLMDLVFSAEASFIPAPISDHKENYRQALVINAPEPLKQLFVKKITALMPEVMPQLRMGRFAVGAIDCQVTASGDGNYFKVHTDAAANETHKRQYTYVYYFNRPPKAFTGGELRIYDDVVRNGKLAATDSYQVIEPRHNTIVFFQAAVMHEVMPVQVPSRQFRDSRFTVNGWIERE
ncbi:MAG TPA: 2OG-Fe(II) oxygenase [Casimicrobiaceae bacterium]|nr:2OG-Fe(II) oxygenase [Casimicrobiaceae bacterium]